MYVLTPGEARLLLIAKSSKCRWGINAKEGWILQAFANPK